MPLPPPAATENATPWPAPLPSPAPRPRDGGRPAPEAGHAAPVPVWADALALDRLLGACRRQHRLAALLLVELQPANPDTAPALVQAVVRRLRGRVRWSDEVALTADGALAVLLRDAGEQASAQVQARLEPLLRSPYRVHADLVRPLLRIGRAVAGLHGQRSVDLLRAAALPARR